MAVNQSKGVVLNYKWNVYKLFKNGKRAKKPFHVFEYEEPERVEEHFNTEIIKEFSEKNRSAKFLILRDDLPQKRQADLKDVNKENLIRQRNKVLQICINKLSSKPEINISIQGALILCKESAWEWQWAVIEAGTSRYIQGLSPTFKSYDKAHLWMNEEIENL